MARHLTGLTGLRGLGAIIVVAYHFGIGPVDGHLGVEIFFVLSGFVGMRAELGRSGVGTFPVLGFLARRVGRILPALAVFVAVRLGFLLWFSTTVRPAEFVGALSFTSNFVYMAARPPWAMVITWSLAVEMQFAIVFAVLMRWTGGRLPRLRAVLIALIAGSTLWRIVLLSAGADSIRLRYALDTRLDQLLFGCLLALLVHTAAPGSRWRALAVHPAAALAATGVVVASVLADNTLGRPYRYGVGMTVDMVAFGMVICGIALSGAPSPGGRGGSILEVPLQWPMLVWIGQRSYSLYLYHTLIYRLALRWSPGRTVPKLVAALVVSMVVAAASHRCIEQRAAAFLERRRGGHPAGGAGRM